MKKPFAVLTARTDLPGRGLFASLYAAPLVLPPLLTAMAWDNLLPREWLDGPEGMGRWSTALQAAGISTRFSGRGPRRPQYVPHADPKTATRFRSARMCSSSE